MHYFYKMIFLYIGLCGLFFSKKTFSVHVDNEIFFSSEKPSPQEMIEKINLFMAIMHTPSDRLFQPACFLNFIIRWIYSYPKDHVWDQEVKKYFSDKIIEEFKVDQTFFKPICSVQTLWFHLLIKFKFNSFVLKDILQLMVFFKTIPGVLDAYCLARLDVVLQCELLLLKKDIFKNEDKNSFDQMELDCFFYLNNFFYDLSRNEKKDQIIFCLLDVQWFLKVLKSIFFESSLLKNQTFFQKNSAILLKLSSFDRLCSFLTGTPFAAFISFEEVNAYAELSKDFSMEDENKFLQLLLIGFMNKKCQISICHDQPMTDLHGDFFIRLERFLLQYHHPNTKTNFFIPDYLYVYIGTLYCYLVQKIDYTQHVPHPFLLKKISDIAGNLQKSKNFFVDYFILMVEKAIVFNDSIEKRGAISLWDLSIKLRDTKK